MPVDSPDKIRKIRIFAEISLIPLCAPTTNTISHEKINTTPVLNAVATLESVFLIPHFANMAVKPANRAEPNANK